MQPARFGIALAGADLRAHLAVGGAVGESVNQLLAAVVNEGHVGSFRPALRYGTAVHTHLEPSRRWKINSSEACLQRDLTFHPNGTFTVDNTYKEVRCEHLYVPC